MPTRRNGWTRQGHLRRLRRLRHLRTKRRLSRKGSRRRSKSRRRHSRGGGETRGKPLSPDAIAELRAELERQYADHPRRAAAERMLNALTYEPDYESEFTGETFEGREDKEYWQGLDKLQAFFKYGA